jgi:hypothetical protein
MTCVHLQQLVQLCEGNQIKLSSSDLIHMVCEQCGKKEVCPSGLYEDFDEAGADDQPGSLPGVPGRETKQRA